MRLEYVKIKNFRSIEDARIDFDPRCRILVGMNDTGKSNVLKALAILGDESLGTESDRRQGVNGGYKNFYVEAVFSPDSNDWNELKTAMRMIIYNHDEYAGKIIEELKNLNIRYPVTSYINEIKVKGNSIIDIEIEHVLNDINFDDNWMKTKKAEIEKIKSSSPHKLVGNFHSYDFVHQKDIVKYPDNINDKILESVSDVGIKKLIYNKIIEWNNKELQIIFWKAGDPKHKIHNQIPFDEFVDAPQNFLFLLNIFKFYENITGNHERANKEYIVETLLRLKNNNNLISSYLSKVAKTFSDNFNKIWQNYILNKKEIVDNNFEFNLKFNNPDLHFSIKEDNEFYDLSQRGDGLKKFAEFMLAASTEINFDNISNTLFIIDEPETSLHPSAAKDFRDELIKISEHNNNYVIYATHSVSMMDRDDFSRHYIVRRKNKITSITPAEEFSISNTNKLQRALEYEILYNEIGYSIYEELQERNIIFEGWADKKLFLVYAKAEKIKIDFGVAHAWGATTFHKISPIMELANRKILIISDCDSEAKKARDSYREENGYRGKDWLLYNEINNKIIAITSEDFIKKEFIVQKINSYVDENKECFLDNIQAFSEKDLLPSSNATIKIGNCDLIKNWIGKNLNEEKIKVSSKTNDVVKKQNKSKAVKKQIKNIKREMFKNLQPDNIVNGYSILHDGIIERLKQD